MRRTYVAVFGLLLSSVPSLFFAAERAPAASLPKAGPRFVRVSEIPAIAPESVDAILRKELGRNPEASRAFAHRFPLSLRTDDRPTALFLPQGNLDSRITKTTAAWFGGDVSVTPVPKDRASSGAAYDYAIVQFEGPLHSFDTEILTGTGARIVGYVPNNAYLLRIPAELSAEFFAPNGGGKLAAAARTRGVRPLTILWREAYHGGLKLPLDLEWLSVALPSGRATLTVRLHPGEHSAGLLSRLESMSIDVLDLVESADGDTLRLNAEFSQAREIAALREVSWIERWHKSRIRNDVARSSGDVSTGRGPNTAGPMMDVEDVWSRGLRGEGQVVAVCDSGVDSGDPATLHPDFGVVGDAGNPSRFVGSWIGNGGPWRDDEVGHGTHVAGSVLGNGVRSGANPAGDVYPATSHAGVAPKASLFVETFTSVESEDLRVFLTPAYEAGARIHTNSWGPSGSAAFGIYQTMENTLDSAVWSNPDLLVLFAAGNDGFDGGSSADGQCAAISAPDGVVDPGQIGSPSTAKNCVAVGASENYRPGAPYGGDCSGLAWGEVFPCSYSAVPIVSDPIADSAIGMAGFSSRGPTKDLRLKPDVVAPGGSITSVLGVAARDSAEANRCIVPASERDSYQTMSGTSMATPLVAGAAAIARQYYTEGWHRNHSATTGSSPSAADGFNPSAALLKATLINGAFDMFPGQHGTGTTQELSRRPDISQGWGRVDLESSLFPDRGFGWSSGRRLEVHDVAPGLTTGGADSYPVSVSGSSDQLRVTLVWTDPAGAAGCAKCLVNDLDLVVTSPSGETHTGNFPIAPEGDHLNNVEGVDVSSPAPGNWTVAVRGTSVPGNGAAGSTTQPYALLVSGGLGSSLPTEPLSLQSDRVKVWVTFRNQYSGETGTGKPLPQKNEFGFFYFSVAGNPEVFVKVLDFGSDRPYLLFAAGLTDFEYTVYFQNVATGKIVSWTKPAGQFAGYVDTTGLPQGPETVKDGSDSLAVYGLSQAALADSARQALDDSLRLSNGRVRVDVTYRNQYSGETGVARPLPKDDNFGFFYFSVPDNPEVFVKALDFGSDRAFLLFYTGLTDFEYTATFTNVCTGETWTQTKAAGATNGGADTSTLDQNGCTSGGD